MYRLAYLKKHGGCSFTELCVNPDTVTRLLISRPFSMTARGCSELRVLGVVPTLGLLTIPCVHGDGTKPSRLLMSGNADARATKSTYEGQ